MGGSDPTHPCDGPGMDSCIDGTHVGVIAVDLSPLTTGSASKTDAVSLGTRLTPRFTVARRATRSSLLVHVANIAQSVNRLCDRHGGHHEPRRGTWALRKTVRYPSGDQLTSVGTAVAGAPTTVMREVVVVALIMALSARWAAAATTATTLATQRRRPVSPAPRCRRRPRARCARARPARARSGRGPIP